MSYSPIVSPSPHPVNQHFPVIDTAGAPHRNCVFFIGRWKIDARRGGCFPSQSDPSNLFLDFGGGWGAGLKR